MQWILRLAFLLAMSFALMPTLAWAGPVLPEPVTIIQPDGSVIVAMPFGDEWDSGYETLDGFTIVRDESSGFWFYALLNSDGRLIPSSLLPGRDAPNGIALHLRNATFARPEYFTLSPQLTSRLAGATGTQPVLVLLASFSNQGPVGSTPAQWSSLFFAPTNSVRHYYLEVSYGQLTLVPVVESHGAANDGIVGWLNLGYPHPNTGGSTSDANRQIVRDALLAADPYVNFAAYDTDHDGYIASDELHIVVIVAGYEASYGGTASACVPNVWAHHWSLSGTVPAPMLDGVHVGSYLGGYSQVGEWHCRSSDHPGHMGTMGQVVHELGHDIGWPDLYDIDGSSYGVGYYSIMAHGSWQRTVGYPGSLPSHPDPFLKWYQGWLTPEQIVGTQAGVQVQQVETNQRVIQLLDNPNGVDWLFGMHSGLGEYFLLENRQPVGYDAGLPGCGVLIWHIDETRTSFNSANANDDRRLVDVEEADGRNDLDRRVNYGDSGDYYPGSTGNMVFDNNSTPNSRLYAGIASGVSITNFSGCSSTMIINISATGSNVTPTYTPTLSRTPTPTKTPIATITPGGLPDLAITSMQANMRGYSGGCVSTYAPLILKVCVVNRGGSAARAFQIEVRGCIPTGERLDVAGLALGASTCLETEDSPIWFIPCEVIVDVDNAVAESNEMNNTMVATLPIPTPPPYCTPTQTPIWSGPTPTPTEILTPTATRTPGGIFFTYLPVILLNSPPPTPTLIPTPTPLPGWRIIMAEDLEDPFPGTWNRLRFHTKQW